MKKLALLAILPLLIPLSASAAGLTTAQASSLVGVVQASPSTPANYFVSLITSFSSITAQQAESLIKVVQASPGTPALAFLGLITSFTTGSTANTNTPAVTPSVIQNTNVCYGSSFPSCPSGQTFVCPANGSGYCESSQALANACQQKVLGLEGQIAQIEQEYAAHPGNFGATATQAYDAEQRQIAALESKAQSEKLNCQS